MRAFAAALSLLALLAACDTVIVDPDPDAPARPPTGPVFLHVDPAPTYLRVHNDRPVAAAVPRMLRSYGLRPGDRACFRAVGDFDIRDGTPASSRGLPLVTAVFSSDNRLLAGDVRQRVPGALAAGTPVVTPRTVSESRATDIPEDFDATDACVTVPPGARYFFLSPFDDFFSDNRQLANAAQRFGVRLSRE
ncbi:MAG: hypothetical protein ACK41D_03500 [Rubricoccaceae bacterium]